MGDIDDIHIVMEGGPNVIILKHDSKIYVDSLNPDTEYNLFPLLMGLN